jgi:rubrerythrin
MIWVCDVCGFEVEADEAPEECPVCGCPKDNFKKKED